MKIIIIEPSGALATGLNFETKDYPRRYEAFEVFDKFMPHPVRILKFLHYVHKLQPDIVHIQGHSHPGSYIAIQYLLKGLTNASIVYTAQDIIPKKKKNIIMPEKANSHYTKILITGSSGFIGSSLCNYFAQHGHYVFGLDRNPSQHAEHICQKFLASDVQGKYVCLFCLKFSRM